MFGDSTSTSEAASGAPVSPRALEPYDEFLAKLSWLPQATERALDQTASAGGGHASPLVPNTWAQPAGSHATAWAPTAPTAWAPPGGSGVVPTAWATPSGASAGPTPWDVPAGPVAASGTSKQWWFHALIALGLCAALAMAGRTFRWPSSRPVPPHPATFDPAVAPIASYIEAETGKPFRYPVYLRFLPTNEFDARLDAKGSGESWSRRGVDDAFLVCAEFGSSAGSCRQIKRHTQPSVNAMFLRFLGADIPLGEPAPEIPFAFPGLGSPRVLHSLSNHDIVGFYESESATVFVRGTDLNAVRQTVAHELVHAWQDQHGFLDGGEDGVDASYVHLAMLEGHAELVAERYLDSLPAAQQFAAVKGDQQLGNEWVEKELADTAPGGSVFSPTNKTRRLELSLGLWPYEAGRQFLSTRSKEEIASLLKRPPASSWDIMNPTADGTGRGTKPKLGSVPGDRYTQKRFVVGPLLWSESMRSVLDDDVAARNFRDAWVGDGAAVFERADEAVCLFDRIEFIDSSGRAAGLIALNQWSAKHPMASGITIAANGLSKVDVTICR